MKLHSFTQTFFQVCRELVLGLGIAILIPFITHYTTLIIHPEPVYKDQGRTYYDRDTDLTLDDSLAEQFRKIKEQRQRAQTPSAALDEAYDALLAQNKALEAKKEEARKLYEVERNDYNRSYFFVALILGLIAIVAGVFIPLISLGVGFVLGGFISLIIGYVTYWGALHNIVKLVSLVGALALILAISFYKFGKQSE